MKKLLKISLILFCAAAVFANEEEKLRDEAEKKQTPEAMLELGNYYFFGSKNTSPNYTLAVYWFRKAAAKGSASGMFNYGICLDRGLGIERDVKKAFEWYSKAAEKGLKIARYNVANMLITGNGTQRSPSLGMMYLHDLASEKFQPAQLRYAELLLARPAAGSEYYDAVKILEELCSSKNPPPQALILLADCKYEGRGTRPDSAGMIKLLERANKSGSAEAAGKLAYCYEYGRAVDVSLEKAYQFYLLGANRGNAMCRYKMGEKYFQDKKFDEALKFYKAAAEQKNPQALFRLGKLYLEGKYVSKNTSQAGRCFFESAKQGYAPAQYSLACLFAEGTEKIPKNEPAAVFWFLEAAKQGDRAAASVMAERYFKGNGVERSITKGEYWQGVANGMGL